MKNLDELMVQLRVFVAERDWAQFHSPKTLSMALSVEAAELLEIFQWLTEEQSRSLDADKCARVSEEVADIFNYLLLICDKLDLDLVTEAKNKIAKNMQKYPAELVRGSAEKPNSIRLRGDGEK